MNKKIFFQFFVFILFTTLIIVSCDDTKPSDLLEVPSSNVSYSQHIQPIFELSCNSGNCHSVQNHAGGLSLTNWANTTSSYLVVAPGHPDNSLLVLSVEGKSTYPMPPAGYSILTENQRIGIRTWVKEGAKNN